MTYVIVNVVLSGKIVLSFLELIDRRASKVQIPFAYADGHV
jgi:hypothetical protein